MPSCLNVKPSCSSLSMVKHCENKKQPYYWFVVGIPSEFVSWDDEIPTMMGKKIPFMFQTINQFNSPPFFTMSASDHRSQRLTGAFTQGMFGNDPSHHIRNVIIPATPSNPFIPYLKRTSKYRCLTN